MTIPTLMCVLVMTGSGQRLIVRVLAVWLVGRLDLIPVVAADKAFDRLTVEAESQWRPGIDPRRFPLLEIFSRNRSAETIWWTDAQLNGQDIRAGTNGVVWSRFFPSAECAAGQTVAFQVCFSEQPASNIVFVFSGAPGVKISSVVSPPSSGPKSKITDIVFDPNGKKAFIAWRGPNGAAVKTVRINGKGYGKQIAQLAKPNGDEPGWVGVLLTEPVKLGEFFHVRLGLKNGEVIQALVRVFTGFSLDSFALADTDPLRRTLDLSETRKVQQLPLNPGDNEAMENSGRMAPTVVEELAAWHESEEDVLASVFMSAMAAPDTLYAIYGPLADFFESCTYKVNLDDPEGKLETAAMRWGREAAMPRPWGWLVEAPLRRSRTMLPEEFRLLAYTALGLGAKGIHYFTSFETSEVEIAYTELPALKKEIIRVNGELKRLEPFLSMAAPVGSKKLEWEGHTIQQYTVWSGDIGMLLILKNLDPMSRPKEGGGYELQMSPVTNLEIAVQRPGWLTPPTKGGAIVWQDGATGQTLHAYMENGKMCLTVPRFELIQTLWLYNLGH